MANDQRVTDVNKKRPTSAPRSSEINTIPKIILEERKESSSASSPSLSRSLHPNVASAGTIHNTGNIVAGTGLQTCPLSTGHMPIRSSSDIGLPAASMPNLALSLAGGGDPTGSDNNLEVFCSPRTFRRSVDLDINSRDHHSGRGQFEWTDSLDSSSNCLKVLSASSRVGSSLSLNSECTARSIGLLSNDSDSDNDVSWSETDKQSMKPSQLRRFMSYPEESASPELCARTSQSLSNLKTADNGQAKEGTDSISQTPDSTGPSTEPTQTNRITKPCESVVPSSPRLVDPRPGSTSDEKLKEKLRRGHKETSYQNREPGRSGVTIPSHMLSYKCDTNDSSRDGRIRQWLQDMDSQN